MDIWEVREKNNRLCKKELHELVWELSEDLRRDVKSGIWYVVTGLLDRLRKDKAFRDKIFSQEAREMIDWEALSVGVDIGPPGVYVGIFGVDHSCKEFAEFIKHYLAYVGFHNVYVGMGD